VGRRRGISVGVARRADRFMDRLWFFKRCSLFEQLDSSELGELERVSRVRTFTRREAIYAPRDEADSVLLVALGRVKIYHLTADGKETVMGFIDVGEIFGELSAIDGVAREEFAEAMEATRVVAIPRRDFSRLLERRPELSLKLTRLIGLRRRQIERRLKSMLFQSHRERLLGLLVELGEKYGQTSECGTLLSIRLSHQELASIIGSTRETITLLLGAFQNEGILRVIRRRICIRNLASLQAMQS
jgi:CRP-like cAMP-binding protein